MSQNLEAKGLAIALVAAEEAYLAEEHEGLAFDSAVTEGIRAYIASQEAAAPSEEPVAWRVRERPGFDWGLVRTDPDRDPHFHCWEKQPLFASPAPVAPVAVSVKGLEWQQVSDARCIGGFRPNEFVADRYTIKRRLNVYYLDDGQFTFMNFGFFDTLEAAKAAAQSDFNARILSSIIPATKGGEDELHAISAAIGSVRFMDPPDGGDVSLAEQVSRMRQALKIAEAGVQAARPIIEALIAQEYNVETWGLRSLLAALSAQDTDGVAKP